MPRPLAEAAAPLPLPQKKKWSTTSMTATTQPHAMRNINNHINAAPDAKIVVVTHSKGIDFLLSGAADKNGNPMSRPYRR